MSTIKITFQTQALDFSPLTRGVVNVIFNDGVQDHTLHEILTTGTDVSYRFKEVSWVSGQDAALNLQQAINFAKSFNRDYSSVGGTKNLVATVIDNEVTITAKSGTFPNGSNYTGNVLVVGGFTIDNSVQIPDLLLSVPASGTIGDCDTIQYSATATGGTSPYTLKNGTTVLQSNWDGTATTFNLNRGTINSLSVTDSDGTVKTLTANVPRKLKIGEFKERATQFDGYSDIIIESVNPVTGTTPVEYSLDDETEVTGGNYQTSNAFPGVFPGLYKLFVKDKYDCEISKVIEVRDFQDVTVDENPRYFDVMSANSLIFYPCRSFDKDIKKNFDNTGSRNELVGVNHRLKQDFDPSDFEGTQIKSSYPFHVITLEEDGLKKDIYPIMVQENLGAKEKVDCKLFQVNGKTGVYFDGGNEYAPSTTTIIGSSPYQPNAFDNKTFLPDWAEEGQLVFLDGIGGKYIENTGYDDVRGGYFVIDAASGQDVDAKIEVIHNIQDYNVFEFYLDVSNISSKARIKIEKGFAFDQIDGDPWASETIQRISDTEKHLLVEWSSSKNRGDMVFQSGIKCKNRIIGTFRPDWDGEAETALEDSGKSSLKQSSYRNYILEFESLTARQVDKFNIASGLDGFSVNGISLTRNEYPESEKLEDSNYFSWKCSLSASGNDLGTKQDEIVLEVSTGVVGGGGTGKEGDIFPQIRPLAINGKILTINDKMVVLD